jgi:hypothetical protein
MTYLILNSYETSANLNGAESMPQIKDKDLIHVLFCKISIMFQNIN